MADDDPEMGTVLIAQEGDAAAPRVPGVVLVDPEKACAMALAAYLRRHTFIVWGGTPSSPGGMTRDREFKIARVLDDYPDAGVKLEYPSAAILPRQEAAFEVGTPNAIEETWNEAANTVIWNLGLVTGEFSVSFWGDYKPLRDAAAADLPGLFNPREVGGVLLRLPRIYACAIGRFTLNGVTRVNVPNRAYENEWELRARVRWDTTALQMRQAYRFLARANLGVDPGA